jgi:hypothetical protein
MRKLMLIAAGLAALAGAQIAVAWGVHGARSVEAVTGTFSANASWTKTRTCMTTDGKTVSITNGRYSGSAVGNPDLAGPIRLAAHSVINTTDNVGVVHGRFRIDVAGRDTVANFSAVYQNGKLVGLARGAVRQPHAWLLANLSAGFVPSTGFTAGKIGNADGGGAVVNGTAGCRPKPRPEKSAARGTISALAANSITVAGLTCVVPADMSGRVVKRFKVGDRAEIHCKLSGSDNTLVSIRKLH